MATFVSDKPIEDKKDDRLSRYTFSSNLCKSIVEWKGTDSLVIALYGRWGSGKSSVINLTKAELSELTDLNKPTIIEFNPWLFSGEEKINEHFFNEIAKELEIQNKTEKDIELAHKLRSYSRIFGLIPTETAFNKLIEKSLIIIGLFGVSAGQVLQWFNLDIGRTKILLFVIGFILLVLSLINSVVGGIADFFEKRGKTNQKTALSFKREIKDSLLRRKNKLLVIIDDIDRLTPEEIRLILKLIKINTDFPNIIYLLSFDREVVQKALGIQAGINGKNYIEKIVQVSFDLPLARQEKVAMILFEELDRILVGLPKSSEKLFDQTYWGNIYHSGFKNFFRNIRDVKRFSSSLEFNLSLLFKGDSMEVNPIDFIAIEAMRVFVPDFYNFMRTRVDLFTMTDTDRGSAQSDSRKQELDQGINQIPEEYKKDVKELLTKLFPQVEGVLSHGYSSYGYEWISIWNRNLRICSPKYYDAYFTLIPGGDESELSQFELDLVLGSINNQEDFERLLREFVANGKIRKVLERLEDYTDDLTKMPDSANKNIVQGLYNISDDLPPDRHGMFDFGVDLQCARIVYQLLKRSTNKEGNFNILKDAIENSKALYGPIYGVSLEAQGAKKDKDDTLIVPKEKLPELYEACLTKINEHRAAGTLIQNKNVLSILYRWKDWSQSEDWKDYVESITKDDQGLVDFIKPFLSESFSHSFGDYVSKKTKKFDYKSLEDFISPEEVKIRFENFRNSNNSLYVNNKELIDLFLGNFGKKSLLLND